MKYFAATILLVLAATGATAQPIGPDVTSWILNTNGATGYGGYPTNVQQVRYSADNVYVSCTCIPGYDIGPWQGNPNIPANQNFVFKITRHPTRNTGTPMATTLGHIGVWTNGVSIFNAKDAMSYNNQKVWNQNAIVVEGMSFDACLGHPAPNGEYHHHLNPRCLYDDADSSKHSPIIGYAFDGYPIYGAYGYRNTDGTGGVTRMRSSYRKRSITQRTTLPGGTQLQAAQYGPDVSARYPIGYYIEDFEYVQGLGDLDENNGRFGKTPEYPEGTYAYFVTLDETGAAAYPYTFGPNYYGVVPAGSTGPQSGHATPTETVVTYTVADVSDVADAAWDVFPNPAAGLVQVRTPVTGGTWALTLTDVTGRTVLSLPGLAQATAHTIDLDGLASGMYVLTASSSTARLSRPLVIAR